MGAQWEGEPGQNLLLSLALEPQMPVEKQFLLNMSVALILTEFLENHLGKIDIKWPNDIFHNKKKIAGILIENSIQGNMITQCIVGMGINVNQTRFHSSSKAGSLATATSQKYHLDELLSELINLLETQLPKRINNENQTIQAYHQKLLFQNQTTRFRYQGVELEGKVEGVDAFGQLRLRIGNELKTFGIKELDWLEI